MAAVVNHFRIAVFRALEQSVFVEIQRPEVIFKLESCCTAVLFVFLKFSVAHIHEFTVLLRRNVVFLGLLTAGWTVSSECDVATTVQIIGNKWKLLIMRNLLSRPWKFNELRKSLNGVSQKVLTDSLRQLESDGIILRTVYPEVPPRVEYSLTELG